MRRSGIASRSCAWSMRIFMIAWRGMSARPDHRDRRRHRQLETTSRRRNHDGYPVCTMARLRGRRATSAVRRLLRCEYRDGRCAAPHRISARVLPRDRARIATGRPRIDGGAGDHLGQYAVLAAFSSRAGSQLGRCPHGGPADRERDPYDSNQAIPTILATRDRERFHKQFPALRIKRVDWFAFAAYPLSGGFQRWSLLSARLARRLLRIERAIEPLLGRHAGFRMMIVIEKASTAPA